MKQVDWRVLTFTAISTLVAWLALIGIISIYLWIR